MFTPLSDRREVEAAAKPVRLFGIASAMRNGG